MKTPRDEARAFVNGFFGMVEKVPRGEVMVARLASMLAARDLEHARATAAIGRALYPAGTAPTLAGKQCGTCSGEGVVAYSEEFPVADRPCPACSPGGER